MAEDDEIAAARAKMIAKRFGSASTSTGGKGSVRRKKKVSSRGAAAQSEQKLNTTMKKLGANSIPGIEEVNFFKEDGRVLHFKNPKVQAAIAANTYVISGHCENKAMQDLLPGIVNQLGMENMAALQGMAGQGGMPGMPGMPGGMAGMPGMPSMPGAQEEDSDDDDDVPDLVEGNFEEVSEK